MRYILALIAIVFLLPIAVHADVRITEIAWMGTADSQYGEWFELYNDGDSSVALSGWKITDGAGTTIYTLSKTISAGGYLLIERVTSSQNPVPGVNDEEGTFGAGGLSNSGEDISLLDKGGSTVQELLFAAGWPAGDAGTKETMQWNGNTWITAGATPKTSSGEDVSESSDEDIEQQTDSTDEKDTDAIPAVSPNKPMLRFTFPPVVYRGVPYPFVIAPILEYNYHVNRGIFYWNMGDGTVIEQTELVPVMHTYRYPGTYTVYFSYGKGDGTTLPILEATKKVVVVTPTVTLSIIEDNALQIKNTSGKLLDLSGWQVRSRTGTTTFSKQTVVAEGATVAFPYDRLSIAPGSSVILMDPSGRAVATTDDRPVVTTTVSASVSEPYASEDTFFDDVVASADSTISEEDIDTKPKQNRTRTIVFGAVALFVIALSLLLERFMAQQE